MFKYFKIAIATLLVIGSGLIAYLFTIVQLSVPELDGTLTVDSLQQGVSIARDERGYPTIKAKNTHDAMFSMGFLHAQERFFQMDMYRRTAAGELAELFGSGVVEKDKQARLHRFRHRAKIALSKLPKEQRNLLKFYTRGINEGLTQLDGIPYEYRILFSTPQPWQEEDSLLVNMVMYMLLQPHSKLDPELINQTAQQIYGKDYSDFLLAKTSDWDAPVDKSVMPLAGFDAIRGLMASANVAANRDNLDKYDETSGHNESQVGSNSWVVSSAFKNNGRAILANDMHLPLTVPNSWYAMTVEFEEGGQAHKATGVTIPGMPVIAAGSNGQLAWGLSNSNGDWNDLVELELVGEDSYKTDNGVQKISVTEETIAVKGSSPVVLKVRETDWGPIISSKSDEKQYAMSWVAHFPEANNLNAWYLSTADSINDAVNIAARSGIPQMNIVFADDSGNTAWTILGRIPRRVGYSGELPSERHTGKQYWDGWLEADEYPTLNSTNSPVIWTANNRVVGGEELLPMGVGAQYALGVRASRIRNVLDSMPAVNEQAMQELQLDKTAILMNRWQALMLKTIGKIEDKTIREQLHKNVSSWDGTANKDSVGYRMIRAFRSIVAERTMKMLGAKLLAKNPAIQWSDLTKQWESPVWALLQAQPEDYVPDNRATWDEFLTTVAIEETYNFYIKAYNGDLTAATWGTVNRLKLSHPLANVLPLGWLLNFPEQAQSGDKNVPVAQLLNFGASVRIVVSPGQEEKGSLTMPVGQAGNPFAPYYGNGHEQWRTGQTLPFLPGAPIYKLALQPKSSQVE
ncbi:penicillin acylase family protein [Pseudoalteromonas prydzensis]|uniref:penicillin acylase family protein n=1 Tax=Pseudoalteromonas prydzensis TaxID=182141 RepID=UPI0007E523CE|nr:penicillin acylase family protein [Pseudoalteromonas prydzensis]MBE0377179.1 penicillin amidase [Pseudoalteromonas prydzensis ACAM 620]